MPRQKLNRYERINADPRVIQGLQHPHELFVDEKKQYSSIVLELACGRGEYSVGLAQQFPDTLFVGIDMNGSRVGVGLDRVHELGLQNVRFVCGIIHHLEKRFPAESVDEIWIVHPDPRPRDRDIKRRLTNPRFLDMYTKILKSGGLLKLKTDDAGLRNYSVEQLALAGWKMMDMTEDLYTSELLDEHHGIQTHYEKLALVQGGNIYYGVWGK